jgi:uncharacterized protein YndB with AHSA1/START domain
MTRVFNAPRELVWKTWTEREHFMAWWGPKGFTIPRCTMDFRVGGKLHYTMRPDDGEEYWCGCIYKEITPPEHLVGASYFSNEQGEVADPVTVGLDANWPKYMEFDVRFEDLGDKTRMVLRQSNITPEMAESVGAGRGWNSSFDKLDQYLTKA